ncbi:MAG: hypothetical protein Q4D04_11420, partial [Clostridia bacterium]|nr:hypothetical protein [Clostridia bacterium]
ASRAVGIRAGAQCDAPTQALLVFRGLRVFAGYTKTNPGWPQTARRRGMGACNHIAQFPQGE